METIYQVRCESSYEQKVEYFYRKKEQNHKTIQHTNEFLIQDLFSFAQTERLLVTLYLPSSSPRGFVEKFDDTSVVLQLLDDNGRMDGIVTVLWEKAELNYAYVLKNKADFS